MSPAQKKFSPSLGGRELSLTFSFIGQDLEIVSPIVAYLDRTLLLIALWNVSPLYASDTASRQKKEDLFDARKKDMVECGDKENG
jgi:hypothetical protein